MLFGLVADGLWINRLSSVNEDFGLIPVTSDTDPLPIPLALFYHCKRKVFASPLDVCLEIGRQRQDEPSPPKRLDYSDRARVILAMLDNREISRSHLQLDPLSPESIRVTNRSRTLPVSVSPATQLAPGESVLLVPPLLVQFGEYAVRVDLPLEDELELAALPNRTIPPGQMAGPLPSRLASTDILDDPALLSWLHTVLGVFQSAACSRDFPKQAARAVVNIVGLDTAAMLQYSEEGRWRIVALHSVTSEKNENTWTPSQTLLNRVRQQRRTFRHLPSSGSETPHSLEEVTALVAAPILDAAGDVIGALYGDRRHGSLSSGTPVISPFEAKMVELIASGIAAGIARLKEAQSAMAARVRFEQFFTPQLAAQLERDPQLLIGRDAEVTLLFADIRGFSRISEHLGPQRTMAWIQDTMGVLSDCVLQCDGVLVDYLGDELMAMWGAPVPQTHHADLACRAAERMLLALPLLNTRWEAELGKTVELGIGINSGIARVGNTGSAQKFKYGPLGDTVNIASRVQGATKYLGTHCLYTGNTRVALQESPATRRLARVRVVNIDRSLDLYELAADPPADWEDRCSGYEKALVALENACLTTAKEQVEAMRISFPDDCAVETLEKRVAEALHKGNRNTTAIWYLPGK